MATAKLYAFTRDLRNRCWKERILVEHWRKAHRVTANVLHLSGVQGHLFDRLVYVKDRGADIGFWGINENQLKAIEYSGLPWSLVLLLGSGLSVCGYLLTADQVRQSIAEKRWSFSRGDWKLHEPDIPDSFKFESIEVLVSSLTGG